MDRYRDFEDLAAHERAGVDYSITAFDRGTGAIVIAPHGGGIEPGTSEIAAAIAGEGYSLYLFEGRKTTGNQDLHITSTRFDEPRCLALLSQSRRVLAIHGADAERSVVLLGGRDRVLTAAVNRELNAAGFATCAADDEIAGALRSNICNRGASGRGCQLEISKCLRQTMFPDLSRTGRRKHTPEFDRFVQALRRALSIADRKS